MNSSRERLAWIVLLSSLFVCLSLTVAVPVSASAILQSATRPLEIFVQANQGTVGVSHNGLGTMALFMGGAPAKLNPHGAILTNARDTALLLVHAPRSETLLTRLQLYGSSNLLVEEATAPRFGVSSREQWLRLSLSNGRLQLSLPASPERPFVVALKTPQGEIMLREPGHYAVEVNHVTTQVFVQRGSALLTAAGQTLTITTDQRASIDTGSPPLGPLDSERNLVKNGDFHQAFAEWAPLAWQTELDDQPEGKTEVALLEGEPTLRFERIGMGHADAEIRQTINQDVTDYSSLRLLVSMRLVDHSLLVCGVDGSECPLIVRIDYENANGGDSSWQQGFYAIGEISSSGAPDVCVRCPQPINPHHQVTLGQIVFYESANLMETLAFQGIAPRRIKSIRLIASGHSFATDVLEVALLARE
jgi:hypothetical protein